MTRIERCAKEVASVSWRSCGKNGVVFKRAKIGLRQEKVDDLKTEKKNWISYVTLGRQTPR